MANVRKSLRHIKFRIHPLRIALYTFISTSINEGKEKHGKNTVTVKFIPTLKKFCAFSVLEINYHF